MEMKKTLWIILALIGIGIISATAYYFGMVQYYTTCFLPGTFIEGQRVDQKKYDDVKMYLETLWKDQYSLTIGDREEKIMAVIKAEDLDLTFSAESFMEKVVAEQNPYAWPIYVFSGKENAYDATYSFAYNEEKLEQALDAAGLFDASSAEKPKDAYISDYIAEKGQYDLIPEQNGALLVQEKSVEAIKSAVANLEQQLIFSEDEWYEKAEITADNKELQKIHKLLNQMVGTQITYDWNGREEILDGSIIHEWLSVEDGEVLLDQEKVRAYVDEKAKAYDTYGKKRKFVTAKGVELTLPSGGYGWKTDREAETEALIQLIQEGTVTTREPIFWTTGYVKGQNDIGASYVEIDMTNQHLYLYIDGEIVLESDFVSGSVADGNTTPPGVFGITYKTRDAVLRGRTYVTPVSYWMPFNGNIGMHDATWRDTFGGDIYLTDGSHGCINLPLDKAAEIYTYMTKRFPVVCYYY
ncbi:MAG: hypothetical protein E7293_09520 [Lachnospiraceae bacterium]|nr:hypothetical protein [Lachnospiraceae bacterium]